MFCVLALSLAISISPVKATSQLSPAPADYKILSGKHPVSGPQQALVVLVEFQDARHTETPDQMKNVAIDQLNSYYSEVSYGKISITGQVYGWYTLNQRIGYYGHDDEKPGSDDNLEQLAKDAVAQLPPSLDLTSFKFLVIVHAGEDQANDKYDVKSDEIWSQCYCAVFPNYEPSDSIYGHGKAFGNYVFLSEFDGVGTFAHEWGHMFGLPDLYDTKNHDSYIGYWSLMDAGNYCCPNNDETTPSYIGAWGDTLLGWFSPTVVDANILVSSYELTPLETRQAGALLIPITRSTYYFVEYRTKAGKDSSLPNSGVLVYYVNELLDTGRGILRLVNPQTGELYSAKDRSSAFNNAVFKTSDQFKDDVHKVFLGFLGGTGSITTLFSTQALTGSFVRTSLKVTRSSLSGMYGEHLTLSGTLVNQNGAAMIGQNVEVDIFNTATGQWEKLASSTTDAQGSVNVAFDLTYPTGIYKLRLLYPGGKGATVWYTSSNADFLLTITPATMNLSLATSLVIVGSSSIEISVTGIHGEPLKNAVVTVYLNGIRIGTIKTDENGKATLPLQFALADLGPRTISAKAELANYSLAQVSATTFVLPLWLIAALIVSIAAILGALWKFKGIGLKIAPRAGMKLTCPSCGKKTPSDSAFCVECGADLSEATPATRRKR